MGPGHFRHDTHDLHTYHTRKDEKWGSFVSFMVVIGILCYISPRYTQTACNMELYSI